MAVLDCDILFQFKSNLYQSWLSYPVRELKLQNRDFQTAVRLKPVFLQLAQQGELEDVIRKRLVFAAKMPESGGVGPHLFLCWQSARRPIVE
ncbi:MAG: hypothetical protein U5J82_09420 [Desulfobacterales bacterium]|nr:hypothetical protein [Desulfobacterales bacterium]